MSSYETGKKIEELADNSSHEEKQTPRVGWRLLSQDYRPMSNMATGYRKRLPQLCPQPSKHRDKKV